MARLGSGNIVVVGWRCDAEDDMNTAAAILTACLAAGTPIDRVLDAIQRVETGGHRDPSNAVGDGGKALGPFQVWRVYWLDSRVPGRYEQVRDAAYARKVVLAYWQRYCPKALASGDAETLARVHNGGPSGHRRASTLGYWSKVRRELSRR